VPDPLDLRPLGATGDPLDPALATLLVPTLTETCTVRRKGATKDSQGADAGSYSDHLTGVAVNLVEDQSEPKEGESGGRIAAVRRFKLLFAVGTDVKPPDRVLIGTDTYEVLHTDRGATGALLLTALAVRAR
jgi:hypothetical protein